MKKDYKYLKREDKKKVKKEFLESEDSLVYRKATRIVILCIFGIVLAIGSLVFDLLFHAQTISFVLDGLLFIFSLLMMIRMIIIQRIEINDFLNKNNNKKKKK